MNATDIQNLNHERRKHASGVEDNLSYHEITYWKIVVTLVKGYNMRKLEQSKQEVLSNPFCVLSIDDRKETQKSQVCNSTSNPDWRNEQFIFIVDQNQPPEFLYILCKDDKIRFFQANIGSVKVRLSDFMEEAQERRFVLLNEKYNDANGIVQCKVHVSKGVKDVRRSIKSKKGKSSYTSCRMCFVPFFCHQRNMNTVPLRKKNPSSEDVFRILKGTDRYMSSDSSGRTSRSCVKSRRSNKAGKFNEADRYNRSISQAFAVKEATDLHEEEESSRNSATNVDGADSIIGHGPPVTSGVSGSNRSTTTYVGYEAGLEDTSSTE